MNPKKYTKYSLADVSRDDMSERTNSRAAFDFLRELKQRRDAEEEKHEEPMPLDGKVAFRKPTKKARKDEDEAASSSSSSSVVQDGNKRVLPECVVGQKRPKDKGQSRSSSKPSKKVKLTQLKG